MVAAVAGVSAEVVDSAVVVVAAEVEVAAVVVRVDFSGNETL